MGYFEVLSSFIYVLFSVSLALSHIRTLIETWPYISRIGMLFRKGKLHKFSTIVVSVAWPLEALGIAVSIIAVSNFIENISQTDPNIWMKLVYALVAFPVFLIPGGISRVIRGTLVALMPGDFKAVREQAEQEQNTIGVLYYTQEYIDQVIKPKGDRRFGIEKATAAFLMTTSLCLLLFFIGHCLVLLLIPLFLALASLLVSPIAEKKWAHKGV